MQISIDARRSGAPARPVPSNPHTQEGHARIRLRGRRVAGAALLIAGVAVLAGCAGSGRCTGNRDYLTARNMPPLKIPDGMYQPDRSTALAVPDGPSGPVDLTRQGRCIDAPPPYFGSAGAVAGSAEEAVAQWASAWAARDTAAVREMYARNFVAPGEAGTAEWLDKRIEQVGTGPVPNPAVEDLKVESAGTQQQIATFIQRFGTNAVRKELVLVREGSSWRILSERVIEVL